MCGRNLGGGGGMLGSFFSLESDSVCIYNNKTITFFPTTSVMLLGLKIHHY